MTHLIGFIPFLFLSPDSSAIDFQLSSLSTPSPLHVIASAFGTAGSYSTQTDSRSFSGYVTFSNAWRDYYTIGYANLWLSSTAAGGKYYSQNLFTGRASWLLPGDRISIAVHYAFLSEGEIQSYSSAATFHWAGGGATYWFSPFQFTAASFSLALSDGGVVAGIYRGIFSLDVGAGIWLTSTVIVNDADFTPSLFSFRQSVSVPLGNDSYIIGSGETGRRGFSFDDEALVIYNQRAIQTAAVGLKAIVRIFDRIYIIPAFEYDALDGYNAKYGSVGIRAVF